MNNMNKSRIIVGIGFVLTIMTIVFVVIFKTNYSYSSDLNYLGEYDSIASDDDGEIEVIESDVASDEENGEVEEEEKINISTEKWDLTKVKIEHDSKGIPVPVPIGYVASKASNENTIKTGFVIYEGDSEVNDENAWNESTKRNQWVWVPVPDLNRVYTEKNGKKMGLLYDYVGTKRNIITGWSEPAIISNYDNENYFARYNLHGYTRDKFYQEMQLEFDATIDSIEKYGGFYIGRYETGNLSKKKPVIQRMNTDISSETWYTMYSKLKYLGANKNVKTNMIWGCLWDETLQWLVDTENKTYEQVGSKSTDWGNYKGVTFEYQNTNGGISTKSSTGKIPTGSTERNKGNNIYDMAGNVWDFSMEAYTKDYRCMRGGAYYYDGDVCPPSEHGSSYMAYPTVSYSYVGTRAYLYIK